MDAFNTFLQRLAQLDLDYQADNSYRDVEKELLGVAQVYEELPEEIQQLLEEGRRPLQPPLYEVTIYYPISRRGELPPSPVTYRSPTPITPAELIDSMAAIYQTPLDSNNIQAYLQLGSDYADLNEPILRSPIMGGPKLRDVIDGHPEALVPYRGGYLLQFEEE